MASLREGGGLGKAKIIGEEECAGECIRGGCSPPSLRGHLLPAAASLTQGYNYAQALSNTKTHLKTNKIMERLFLHRLLLLGWEVNLDNGQYTTNLIISHHANLCQTQDFKMWENN